MGASVGDMGEKLVSGPAVAVYFAGAAAGWWAVAAHGGAAAWIGAVAATVALLAGLFARHALGLVFWWLLRDRRGRGRRD